MAELRARIISAIILGPLVLAAVVAGAWAYLAVVMAFAAAALHEWGRLVLPESPVSVRISIPSLGVLCVASLVLGGPVLSLSLLLGATILVMVMAQTRGLARPLPLALGLPYVCLGAMALLWLRERPDIGLSMTLFLLAIVWAGDTGAFVAGRAIGGLKLWPRISPQKTWAGLLGGSVAACLAGILMAMLVGDVHLAIAVVASIPVALGGQAGDLLESALKRSRQVKDSGGLIPGHGGVLDRVDALLVAAPVLVIVHLVLNGKAGWWG